jgi:hypothetical protein
LSVRVPVKTHNTLNACSNNTDGLPMSVPKPRHYGSNGCPEILHTSIQQVVNKKTGYAEVYFPSILFSSGPSSPSAKPLSWTVLSATYRVTLLSNSRLRHRQVREKDARNVALFPIDSLHLRPYSRGAHRSLIYRFIFHAHPSLKLDNADPVTRYPFASRWDRLFRRHVPASRASILRAGMSPTIRTIYTPITSPSPCTKHA